MEASSGANLKTAVQNMAISDDAERDRLLRTLQLARERFQSLRGQVHWAVAMLNNYSESERRLPVQVAAPFHSDDDYYELEDLIAKEVLGPVLVATKISMPVTIADVPPGREQAPFQAPGLLVP